MQKTKPNTGENQGAGLLKTFNQLLLLVDQSGEIQFSSRAFNELFEIRDGELEGRQIFDLHPQEARGEIENLLKGERGSTSKPIRTTLLTGTGEQRQVLLAADHGNFSGQPVSIIAYVLAGETTGDLAPEVHKDLTSACEDLFGVLNASLDLEQVLDQILATLCKMIPCKAVNILRIEGQEGRVIRCQGYNELGTEETILSRVYDIKNIKSFAKMISIHETLRIPDTRNYPGWVSMPETNWIRSFLGTPIVIRGEVYALLNCDDSAVGRFTESDASLLQAYAAHAAFAIENAWIFADTQQRLKRITGINELLQELIRVKGVEEVFQCLPERFLRIFEADHVVVTRWNAEKGVVDQFISAGEANAAKLLKGSQAGQRLLTEIVLEKKKTFLADENLPDIGWDASLRNSFPDPYVLVLPLIVADQPRGAILCGYRDPRQITEMDVSMAEYTCNQLAACIHKIEIYEEIDRHNSQLDYASGIISSLTEVAVSIKNAMGPTQAMAIMGDGLRAIHIGSVVFLTDPATGELRLEYLSSQKELSSILQKLGLPFHVPWTIDRDLYPGLYEQLNSHELTVIEAPAEFLKKCIPVSVVPFLPDVQRKMGISNESKVLLIPLIAGHRNMGWLGLIGQSIQELDRQAAEIFSAQISSALENSKLLAEIQHLAITDELTGIRNRRGLFDIGAREFSISRRLNRPFSALMIDLDDFKSVNDRLGHSVGDQALTELTKRLVNSLREIDIIGRYGGEEFVVLLVESDSASAFSVAERLRAEVCDHPFNTSKGSVDIAVSIGIAEISEQTKNLEELIENADKALYVAKHRGKNQVAEF